MTEYEILLMLDPEVPDERHEEILTRTRELIERGGGTFGTHDVWGRRRLAYPIQKRTDGVYHLLTFTSDASTLDEVARVLRITDGVMRHMAVRRPTRSGATAGTPAAGPGARAEYAASATPEEQEGA